MKGGIGFDGGFIHGEQRRGFIFHAQAKRRGEVRYGGTESQEDANEVGRGGDPSDWLRE